MKWRNSPKGVGRKPSWTFAFFFFSSYIWKYLVFLFSVNSVLSSLNRERKNREEKGGGPWNQRMILPWDKGLSHQRLKLLICTLTLTTKPTLISRRANKNFVLIFLNHRNYWINKNKSHISLKKLVSKYLYKNIKVYKFFCFCFVWSLCWSLETSHA